MSNHVKSATINIFANDVVVYASHSDIDVLRQKLQESINSISSWYTTNKLALSIEKCNSMVINHNLTQAPPEISLLLDGQTLKQLKHVRYLGVTIDEKLKWDRHVSDIVKRVSFATKGLCRLRENLAIDILIDIYTDTIIPVMDYASTLWGHASCSAINDIHSLENRIARTILNKLQDRTVDGDRLYVL